MARIVNLDELLPPDIVFVWQEKEYTVPGDLDVQQVFGLFEMFSELRDEIASEDGDERPAAASKALASMQGELLKIFQVRNPDLTELPFGVRGTAIVIQNLLQQLNPAAEDEEGEESLPPTSGASSKTAGKKSTTAGKRPRSRGSRSS